MDKFERIQAMIEGKQVDRVPISFWMHFPDVDRDGVKLARKLLEFHKKYDLDFMKVSPSGNYFVDEVEIVKPMHSDKRQTQQFSEYLVKEVEDWDLLRLPDPYKGQLGEQLKALEVISIEIDAPFVATVYSPLTVAYRLAGGLLFKHIVEHPDKIHNILQKITAATIEYVREIVKRGAGIFLATQLASYEYLTLEDYRKLGLRYDLEVLRAASMAKLNILHLHGKKVMFELINEFPVHAVNWHSHETQPTISEAKQLTSKVLVAGLNQEEMIIDDAALVRSKVKSRISEARSLVIASECVLSTKTSMENMFAAVKAVRLPE